MQRFLDLIARTSARYPLPVLIALVLVTIGMGFAVTQLRVANDPAEFMPHHPKVLAYNEIERRFGTASFSHTLFVRFAPREAASISSPEAILEMEAALEALRRIPGVVEVQGIPDFVKAIHSGLHGGDRRYFTLPVEGCELGYSFEDVIRLAFQRISLLKRFTSQEGTAIALAKVDKGYDIVEVSRAVEEALREVQEEHDALEIGLLSYGSAIRVFNEVTRKDIRLFAPFTALIGVLILIWLFRVRRSRELLLLAGLVAAAVVVSFASALPAALAAGLTIASGLLLITAALLDGRPRLIQILLGLLLLGFLLWRRDGLGLGVLALFAVGVSFRRLSDLYLPLLVVILAALWTFGLLGLFHIPINFLMVAVLPLLLGVGIDDAIHMLHRYEDERRAGKSGPEAIRIAITRTGRALLLTTVTTTCGFSSLLLSGSPPIQRFGLLAAFAMVTSFIITMALIPAVKNLLREGALTNPGGRETRLGLGLRRHVAAIGRPKVARLVLLITLLLGVGAFLSGRGLELYAFDLRRMLPQDFPIVRLYNEINEEFRIYDEVDILLEGEIARLEVMRAMVEAAPTALSRSPYIRRITSIAQFLDDVRRANPKLEAEFMERFTQEGPDAAYRFLLDYVFSRPDLRAQAEGYVWRDANGDYTKAVIRADVLRYHRYEKAKEVAADVTARVKPLVEELERLGLVVRVTGSPYLTEISLRTLREGFFESMGLAFLLCFGAIALVFRSVIWGLVSLVPMALVMGLELGTIKLLGIKINASTAMVAAISIGLGVDYAIHLVQRFREVGDLGWATSRTGEALFGSCSTTLAAFFALILGEILWNRDFGLLSGTAILYAFAITVLILPALLALIAHLGEKRMRGEKG